MSETRIGFREEEPSAEWSAIPVSDIIEKLPRLQKKLEEYKRRNEEKGIAYIHPELLELQGGMLAVLKPIVLESVITMAQEKAPDDQVYLHEVALLVHETTGLDVLRAATVPFRFSETVDDYVPDYERLETEAGQVGLDFSKAYAIARSYCRGTPGLTGGTGLPEA